MMFPLLSAKLMHRNSVQEQENPLQEKYCPKFNGNSKKGGLVSFMVENFLILH